MDTARGTWLTPLMSEGPRKPSQLKIASQSLILRTGCHSRPLAFFAGQLVHLTPPPGLGAHVVHRAENLDGLLHMIVFEPAHALGPAVPTLAGLRLAPHEKRRQPPETPEIVIVQDDKRRDVRLIAEPCPERCRARIRARRPCTRNRT